MVCHFDTVSNSKMQVQVLAHTHVRMDLRLTDRCAWLVLYSDYSFFRILSSMAHLYAQYITLQCFFPSQMPNHTVVTYFLNSSYLAHKLTGIGGIHGHDKNP